MHALTVLNTLGMLIGEKAARLCHEQGENKLAIEQKVQEFDHWFNTRAKHSVINDEQVLFMFVIFTLWEAKTTLGISEEALTEVLDEWIPQAVECESHARQPFFRHQKRGLSITVHLGSTHDVAGLLLSFVHE